MPLCIPPDVFHVLSNYRRINSYGIHGMPVLILDSSKHSVIRTYIRFHNILSRFKMNSRRSHIELYSKVPGNDQSDASSSGLQQSSSESTPQDGLTFQEIASFLRPYFWPENSLSNRIRCIATGVMVCMSKICAVTAPLYISGATNALVDEDYSIATVYLVMYCLLRLLAVSFKELQSVVYLSVSKQASVDISVKAYRHIHDMSLHWHTSKKMGELLRVLDRGASAANDLISFALLTLIPGLCESIAVCVMFSTRFKQWELSVVVLIGVIFYTVITRVVTTRRKERRQASIKQDNEYHQHATDSIINYETVKNFCGEAFETERYRASVSEYQQSLKDIQSATCVLKILQQCVVNGCLLANLLITTSRLRSGSMSVGDFVAVNSYTINVYPPLNTVGGVYNSIVQALTDLSNLLALLRLEGDNGDNDCTTEIPVYGNAQGLHGGVSVEFDGVSFTYPGQSVVKGIRDINFFVAPGSTTAVVGHSGSGKTTLLKLLLRFYDPHTGYIRMGGYDIHNYSQTSVRQCLGVVPQDTVLFNDTILHNIRYGNMNASMQEIVAAADAAQIREFIESLPDKWNTQVGERGLKLSGGEKQRIAVARCLIKNPPVVILDEATSALDTITEKSVQEALRILGQNRTVIVIAHRLSTVRDADNILVLDEGTIVQSGTHEELIAQNGQYRMLWESQSSDDMKKTIS